MLKYLATYLTIPYIKNRAKVTNLKSVTISAINDVLESCSVSALRDDPENKDLPVEDNGDLSNESRGMKYHVCIKNLQGMKDEERRRRKGNLNRMKKNCKNCKKATCPKHRSKKVDGGFHCDICDR